MKECSVESDRWYLDNVLIERGCPRGPEVPIRVGSSSVSRVVSSGVELWNSGRTSVATTSSMSTLSTPVHFCSLPWSSTQYNQYFPRDFFSSSVSEASWFAPCTRIDELTKGPRSRDPWILRTTWNSPACWGPGKLESDSFSAASAPL